MANMIPISTVTVGSGGAATIDFINIPQNYTDLVVKLSARSTYTSGRANTIQLNLNGSATGFSGKDVYGDGSSAASYSPTVAIGATPSATSTSNTFSNLEIYFPNYTSSAYKSYLVDSAQDDNNTGAYLDLTAGLWSNTAAINSISIITNVNNWAQYSTAHLYGIRKY